MKRMSSDDHSEPSCINMVMEGSEWRASFTAVRFLVDTFVRGAFDVFFLHSFLLSLVLPWKLYPFLASAITSIWPGRTSHVLHVYIHVDYDHHDDTPKRWNKEQHIHICLSNESNLYNILLTQDTQLTCGEQNRDNTIAIGIGMTSMCVVHHLYKQSKDQVQGVSQDGQR